MKKKITLICTSAAAIILEILPFGAVCVFSGGAKDVYKTYSYFSFTPFRNGIYGPIVTAVASCLVLGMSVFYYYKTKKNIETAIAFISLISFLASVTPLFYGIEHFTVIGGFVSAILLANFITAMMKLKRRD